jgi:hypothetical protein
MQNFHKTNMTLWGAVLGGVIILSLVVYYLHSSALVTPLPESQDVAQLMFYAAVILAIGILFLKRSVLAPAKTINKVLAPAKTINKAKKLAEEQVEQFVMNKIRRNYIIIWAMAELICLIGFFNYMMLADIQNYLIFAIVSIYSLLINMPREALVIQSLKMLKE